MIGELLSEEKSHVLSCFPTGSGKTLPMLITASVSETRLEIQMFMGAIRIRVAVLEIKYPR